MFNTETGYGWVSRLLHWGIALSVVGMFALGLWMRSLDYYSPYYKTGPDLHRSLGMILLALMVFRLVWRQINHAPRHDITPMEHRLSHLVHLTLYALLFLLMIAGYFISTADGRPISVFGLIDVPALIEAKGLEKTAGVTHYYIAFAVMALAGLHALAALFHHFVKRDGVLMSMLTGRPRNP